MAERRENSVLFSLSELRRIEEDRIKQEEAEVRAREEAERQARLAAEQRAREEEERKRREAEEFAMRERLEKERMAHEAQARVAEAERLARIQADARLREQQMHLEIQMKAKHPPIKAIVTIVGALFAVVLGLGYYMYSQHEAEKKQQQAMIEAERARAQKAEEERQALMKEISRIEKEQAELQTQLANAKSAADREAIQRRMEANKARVNSLKSGGSKPASEGVKIKIDTSGNDPLGGIK